MKNISFFGEALDTQNIQRKHCCIAGIDGSVTVLRTLKNKFFYQTGWIFTSEFTFKHEIDFHE